MIVDYIKLAYNSLKHRKIRSWLTIIGIIIGIAAIISLITVSQGLENTIEEQFELFGKDRILIAAEGFQGPGTVSEGISLDDVDTIESLGEFKYVTYFISRNSEVERNNEKKFTLVVGFPGEDVKQLFNDVDVEVESGRFFSKGEKGVAVMGFRAARDMFKQEIRVRNNLKIFGKKFRVVGIMEEVGNPQDDNQILIPEEDAREIFNEPKKVEGIMAQVKPGANIPSIQKKIERALEKERDDENFQVVTPTQILDQINNVLGIVQFILVGIAAISLIVGGIGIMNSTYTSVLERTKEIGIMKAIGAQNKDILSLFLIESGFFGLIGGIFGVLLGTAAAKLVQFIAEQAGFSLIKVSIDPKLILFGLLFAVLVGMMSGIVPAYRASKLKPADALRYE